jgi:outer membrane receptor protein involved in Fe transport
MNMRHVVLAGGLAVLVIAGRGALAAEPPTNGMAESPLVSGAAEPPKPAVEAVVVKAKRLNAARSNIQPALGATVTHFDPKTIEAVAQGSNAGLNQVLLRAPGVAQDSFGQIHVRGDHNEVQYRLDGVELPEGLSVFSQALQTRFAHNLDFITGALPAQYGQLQAAVIDITTRSGATDPGGEISMYGGSRDYFNPSASYGGSAGAWNYFFTGDFLHSRVGVENPTGGFNADHDLSNQYHGLGKLEYIPDADTRLSLTAGVSSAQFQIPNVPGQTPQLGYNLGGVSTFDSLNLDEHQREITDFAILSLQKHFDTVDVQSSVFSRYTSLYFSPDPVGDLLFTGIAQRAARSVWSTGTQTDTTWAVNDAHTLRAGFQVSLERTVTSTQSEVFPLDAAGQQIGNQPELIQTGGGKSGSVGGVYLQDEWRIFPGVTLNYGGRFDWVDEFTHESQFSPRVNLAWQATPGTTVHAGYAHYFTPPPFELVGGTDLDRFVGTSAAPSVTRDDPVRAEHDNYFDAGVDQHLAPGWRVGIDAYFKQARNLIDEGQFGAPIILSGFNYQKGQAGGVEVSTSYDRGPWSLYANVANSRAIGKNIVSAQFNFSPDELAYISQHYIHLDHDERWAGSGGVAYTAFMDSNYPTRISADMIVGSGLRADGAVPNGVALPGYYTINLSAVQQLKSLWLRGVELRVDILNLLDRRYEIRDGTGVGVGAPQFGLRRTFLAGITQKF